MSVADDVRAYLDEELGVAGAREIDRELPLVQRGVIDSIELMQIVLFLERTYRLQIDETEVLPANFRNLAAIEAFVDRKRDEAAAAPSGS